LSFNVDPNSTLIINVRSDTTYQIEVIGMKPNGSFYFNLGDFLGSPAYRWNTQPIFSAKGIDPNNIQADINGHWSMTLTVLVAKMYILMDICKLQVLVQMIQMLI
jgi:hypothetical protein